MITTLSPTMMQKQLSAAVQEYQRTIAELCARIGNMAMENATLKEQIAGLQADLNKKMEGARNEPPVPLQAASPPILVYDGEG